MKKPFIVILIIAAAGGVAWFSLSKDKSETAAVASAGPVTVEAKKGSVSVVVEGAAIVEPYQQVTLRSPASSMLTRVARGGESFDRNGIVASLDDTVLRNTLAQAELLLAQAEVDARRAKLASERAAKDVRDKKTLLDNRALSPDQYAVAEEAARNADLALEAAELKVKQSRLSVDRARKELKETMIRAPFPGTVLKTFVAPGDLVSANAPIALFGDISRLRLIAEVDEFDIGKISLGQIVTIGGDSVGPEPIRSKVESISPMAEIVNNISIFEVSALVNNTEGKLRPGMSADFSILIKSDKGLVVPAKSISTVRGRSYINVLENGEIVKKRVEIGANDGINIVVLEGIEEGAQVVVPGAVPASAAAQPAASGEKSVLPITIPGAGGSR